MGDVLMPLLPGTSVYVTDRQLAHDVDTLVKLCGGCVTRQSDKAELILASQYDRRFADRVQTQMRWLFDSVAAGQALDASSYSL